jgi:hypothetical protein
MGIFHLFNRNLFVAGASNPSAASDQNVADNVKDISHYCAGCRKFSCTSSEEHRIFHRVSMYKYCIVGIIDCCKRMRAWNQHRAYICFDSVLCISCNAEKFDIASHLFCIADILGSDLGNSFCINIIEYYTGIKGNRCQNCDFTSCIQTFDICGRVCLRIAKLCGKCQGIFKFHPFLSHLCQNKVRGTVYDSHHFCHMVSCQTLFQWPDDRNSACNSSFEQEIYLIIMCCFQ